MIHYLGKRVLVTVGDNDAARLTAVRLISPNGCYVELTGDGADDNHIGWVRADSVKVVDVFGPAEEPRSNYMRRCYEKVSNG